MAEPDIIEERQKLSSLGPWFQIDVVQVFHLQAILFYFVFQKSMLNSLYVWLRGMSGFRLLNTIRQKSRRDSVYHASF